MYDEIQSEFKNLLTEATGQFGLSFPFVPDVCSGILARTLGPVASELAKAEEAGDFGLLFEDRGAFPVFSDFIEGYRSLFASLAEFSQSVDTALEELLHTQDMAKHFEASGKSAKNSFVAILLRFFGWAARSASKSLESFACGEKTPTATEKKIQTLLAEVDKYTGPEDQGFERAPFRALVVSLAAEGRPFSAAMVTKHLHKQIDLFRQYLGGRSFSALAKDTKVSSSTLRKLFGPNPSTGVTAGTLARVAVDLNVPLLGVWPSREPDAAQKTPAHDGANAEAPDVAPDVGTDAEAPDPTMVEFRHSSTIRAEQDQRLTMRAREFVETTCVFDSDTACKLDCDDSQTILTVLRNIRREKGVNDDLGIEDAQKYKLARRLWLVFRCDTGIDTSLNVRAIERLLTEVDTMFERLQHVDEVRVDVRNFIGSHSLESSISRSRFARITGVDTTEWPAAISAPKIVRNAGVDSVIKLFDATPCPVSVDPEDSRSDFTSELFRVVEARSESAVAEYKVAESAVLAQVQRLQEELASLTAKVNGRLTH